jgi:predicted dehydrogenase
MGTNYAKWITEGRIPGLSLAAVCDAEQARTKKLIADLSITIPTFNNYNELIVSGTVDAVLIATPHFLHADIAIAALQNNLHVLVEKPAGIYAEKVRQMNDEATKHPDLVYAMMFNQRANPLYQRIKQIIDSGRLGGIRRISWIITSWWRTQKYYDSNAWRATWSGEGGGVLVNQAPHQIDLLTWLFGLPSSVRSFIKYGSHRNILVDDDATIYFEYASGATGTFITCTHDALGTDRFEVLGDNGKIIITDSSKVIVRFLTKPEEELNKSLDFRQMLALVRGETTEKLFQEEVFEMPERWDIQHLDILANFTDAILNGAPLIAPGSDGITSVEFVNAMYLSSWKNSTVDIPVFPEEFTAELTKKIEHEKKLQNLN